MRLIPFSSDHLDELDNYGCQEFLKPHASLIREQRYEDKGPAVSIVMDGNIVGAAGLIEMNPYRAAGWALLARTGKTFLPIHRATLSFLDEQTYKRIDAHVAVDDKQGHRWARLLGFQVWIFRDPWALPDGGSITHYVRWG